MLRSAKDLRGHRLDLTDGELGRCHDCYFDDTNWRVRYFVVDTGTWLPGRRVLISPASVGPPDWSSRTLPVHLTREQVRNSPDVDTARPVSRQIEAQLSEYYGWPSYWRPPAAGLSTYVPPAPATATAVAPPTPQITGDPHLRSLREVLGYRVHGRDGACGHLDDLVVDDLDWVLRYLVVDTGNWLPGRKVLISPHWCDEINWDAQTLHVGLHRDSIKNSPAYDPSEPINRDYEGRLYDWYGRPGYWL